MLLEKIRIENFKGLRDANFDATSFSCLVGENNAGKSTVLQAIVSALRQEKIPSSQFYDQNLPVVFTMDFTGVSLEHLERLAEEHRLKFEPLIVDGALTVISRCKLDDKPELRVLKRTANDARYRDEALNEAFKGKSGKAAVQAVLTASYPEFAIGAPETIASIGAVKGFLAERINALSPENFSLQEGPLPSGISTSISALLPEPIYIPAVKNLADDLKTTQSTSFGRLLGLLLEDMAPDLAHIQDSLQTLNRLLNRGILTDATPDARHTKVKDLESLVEKLLGQNFPQARVELHIPPPELKAILNAAQIIIDDGSRDLIDNKGDGIKRSLTFALLQAYVQRQSERKDLAQTVAARPLIFLFEEPELYLHPKAQRILFHTLSTISKIHQVIVTTHSPLFFSPGVTAGFTRVAKQVAQPKPIGVLYPVNFKLDAESAEVFRLAKFENADAAFFSSRVVLFEGESDDAFFRHVAQLLDSACDFDKKNIALVRVSGKGNFEKFRKFFMSFGIQVKLVADLDALFEGYKHLGGDAAAELLRSSTIQQIDDRIQAAGIKAEPSKRQIKNRANRVEQYAEAKLALQQMRDKNALDEECLAKLDKLFVWEKDIAREKACRDDLDARKALVPLLDVLRAQGICVLSKGAIEDYYPAGCPESGAKPARALKAISMIQTNAHAVQLSSPLGADRNSELHDIVTAIFDGL